MKRFAGTRAVLWTERQPDLAQVGKLLERLGCEVLGLGSLEELKKEIRGRGVQLIVSQICPCCQEWKALLGEVRPAGKLPPVLLVASGFDVDLYLEAMRRGAFDCIALPLGESELIRIASNALALQERQEICNAGAL